MNFLKFVVPLAVVLGGALWGMNKYTETKHHDEYLLEKADLRSQYLERAAVVRDTADVNQYRDESRDLFKWWFTQLTELYNRYPEYKPNDDAYLKDLEARKALGGKDAEKAEEFKASYDQVKDVFDLIKNGKYSPAMTAGNGSMRIDFLEFVPATEDKQKGIKGRFMVWGTPRHYTEEKLPGGTTTVHRVDVQLQVGDVSLKLSGDDEKPVGEASFGLPAGPFVPVPEQKIEDFPPLAYVGDFFFPLLPFKATKADIDTSATVRTGKGNDVVASFSWPKHELPAEWRLKDGEEWKGADVQESEELDPARAVKKKH